MLRYAIKRIALALPTLVGITIVTFFIIHLAPGDPVTAQLGSGGRGSVSEEDVERLRRMYFLDLPLFLNFSPKDCRHFIVENIEGLADPLKRDGHTKVLRRRGTVAVPYLWERRGHPGVDEVLRGICGDHPAVCPNGDLSALLKASLDPKPHRDHGTAAVWPLMELIRDGSEAERMAAVVEMAAIEKNTSTYGPGSDPDRREKVLDDWREWWFSNERLHREFTPMERVLGVLTETQYAKWLWRVATGSFGYARSTRPVSEEIAEALPVTALLALLAALFAYLVAIPLGVWSAVRHESWADRSIGTVLFIMYSLPSFWVASVLILLFGGQGFWDLLPIYGHCPLGAETLPFAERILACAPHLVLPVLCLAYPSLAVISRYQRSGLLDVVRQDYIRTARAKGLPERAVIFKHALRNSLLPIITYLGLHIPFLLGGSIIVEKIFSVPGMGKLLYDAIWERDYPVIMATTVVAGVITLVGVLVTDLLYAVADPRITYEES